MRLVRPGGHDAMLGEQQNYLERRCASLTKIRHHSYSNYIKIHFHSVMTSNEGLMTDTDV